MTGDNTDGTTNIVPLMNPGVLKRGYLRILTRIYSPPMLYQRIRILLSTYNPVNRPVHLEWNEIFAFFRSILLLGILGRERKYYWRLVFWSLLRKPSVFPLAVTLSIYGYHFRRITEKLVGDETLEKAGYEKVLTSRSKLKSQTHSIAD